MHITLPCTLTVHVTLSQVSEMMGWSEDPRMAGPRGQKNQTRRCRERQNGRTAELAPGRTRAVLWRYGPRRPAATHGSSSSRSRSSSK